MPAWHLTLFLHSKAQLASLLGNFSGQTFKFQIDLCAGSCFFFEHASLLSKPDVLCFQLCFQRRLRISFRTGADGPQASVSLHVFECPSGVSGVVVPMIVPVGCLSVSSSVSCPPGPLSVRWVSPGVVCSFLRCPPAFFGRPSIVRSVSAVCPSGVRRGRLPVGEHKMLKFMWPNG